MTDPKGQEASVRKSLALAGMGPPNGLVHNLDTVMIHVS